MATFYGSNASDHIVGTPARDTATGGAGDDWLEGLEGADRLSGEIGDDSLYGGDGNDILKGGSGYDYLVGGQGTDTLDGGTTLDPGAPRFWNEVDTVSYYWDGGAVGVIVNLALGTATDSFGSTDTLIDIERVVGTSYDDILIGGNARNDKFEVFVGDQGDDRIDGGSGWDVAEYYYDDEGGGESGIEVNLASGYIRDGFGTSDSVTGIEEVRGTKRSDDFKGSDQDDRFVTSGGSDYVDGREGWDSLSYAIDHWRDGVAGIDANLVTGTIIDTQGYIDVVKSIEAITGSFWDDRIVGSDTENHLGGNQGSDVLRGRLGNDELYGGEGDDTLFGGGGRDYVEGWQGTDYLRGGAEVDYFGIFDDSDTDILLDFKTGTDKLDVSSFGFASTAEVMALFRIVSPGVGLLELPGETFVEFRNVNTSSKVLVAGDLII